MTVVTQKEEKDYSWQSNIYELVVECMEKGVAPVVQYPIDESLDVRRHKYNKVSLSQKHFTGASTNPKKADLEKDVNCMIDFVKVQPHIFVFNLAFGAFFWLGSGSKT